MSVVPVLTRRKVAAGVARIVFYGTLLTAAGYALLSITVPEGHHGLAPIPMTVTMPDGHRETTGFRGLVVTDDSPPVLKLELSNLPRDLPLLAGTLDRYFGSSDTLQVSASQSAWAAARRLLGAEVQSGFMLTGRRVPLPLLEGDTIVRIDGHSNVLAAKDKLEKGRVTVTVLRDSQEMDVPLRRGLSLSDNWVRVVPVGVIDPPVRVHGLVGVHGSSSGLALALSYIDAMTPGDLAGGRTIAVTGSIFPTILGEDIVTSVGAVQAKTRSAIASDADLLLVPWKNLTVAQREADSLGSSLRIEPVGSVHEAVALLCREGGQSTACRRAENFHVQMMNDVMAAQL